MKKDNFFWFLILPLYFCVGSILSYIFPMTKNIKVIMEVILTLLFFAVLVVLYKQKLKEDFSVIKNTKKSTIIKKYLLYLLLWIIFYCVVIELKNLLGGNNIATSINQKSLDKMFEKNAIIFVFICDIIGPISEEIIFRMKILKVFKNTNIGLIISSFMFALCHFISSIGRISLGVFLIQLIPYLYMGFMLGIIYKKTNNIYYSMAIHISNNLLVSLVRIYL